MDNGYIYDKPIYNSTKYLYDVPVILNNNDINIYNCYRILNSTPLVYKEKPGFFYISEDNKYIYFKDTDVFIDILKNIIYSINNPLKTNQDLLEINNDPIQKYTEITSITIPEAMCINFALEENTIDRLNQITNVGKYNSYDCLVKNISNNSFTNIEKKETIYERLTELFTPKESPKIINENINIIDIHTYNKFYVYSLASLNMLLIMIVILMLVTMPDIHKQKKYR